MQPAGEGTRFQNAAASKSGGGRDPSLHAERSAPGCKMGSEHRKRREGTHRMLPNYSPSFTLICGAAPAPPTLPPVPNGGAQPAAGGPWRGDGQSARLPKRSPRPALPSCHFQAGPARRDALLRRGAGRPGAPRPGGGSTVAARTATSRARRRPPSPPPRPLLRGPQPHLRPPPRGGRPYPLPAMLGSRERPRRVGRARRYAAGPPVPCSGRPRGADGGGWRRGCGRLRSWGCPRSAPRSGPPPAAPLSKWRRASWG